jgi:hypothetical protein
MTTLWVLILGIQNAAGQALINHTGAQLAMQPVATYGTQDECQTSAGRLYKFLTTHSVSVDVLCLPTGVSDPVAKHYEAK